MASTVARSELGEQRIIALPGNVRPHKQVVQGNGPLTQGLEFHPSMRKTSAYFVPLLLALFSPGALAQCWTEGPDRSAVELMACFMAEYQRCEETIPDFRAKAKKSIEKLTSHPKYREIAKSKDFDRFRLEAYKNLVATKWRGGDGCRSTLETLESGKF